jgi:hypothetical protein
MAILTVSFVTAVQNFPVGTVGGFYRCTVDNGIGGVAILESELTEFTFNDVAPGDYTVTAERLDGAGVALVPPITKSVNVPVEAVAISVPIDFSVNVA